MAIKTDEVAFTDQMPWRGIATRVKSTATVKEMMRAANVDFTIARNPIYRADGKEIPDFFELAKKEKPTHTFDIVGSRYIPTQPRDAMSFFHDLVAKGKAKMEYMGGMMDHRIVWGLAAVQEDITLPDGDVLRPYLFLASPAIQGKSLIARLTMKRDACNNNMSIALRRGRHGVGDTFRMNHRNQFDEVQQEQARQVIGVARDQAKEFAATAAKLSRKRMTKDAAQKIMIDMLGEGSRVNKIMEAYSSAPGASPGTAWGALNALTYWADHLAGNSEDRRVTNALIGRNASRKVELMERLIEA